MTANPLKEYVRLREVILARKAAIEAELQDVEVVLSGMQLPPTGVESTAPRVRTQRVRNAMSLGDAVFAVTRDAALSKEDILSALDRLGYRFSGKSSPAEELGSLLQLDKRFEASGGKYGPTLEALFPAA